MNYSSVGTISSPTLQMRNLKLRDVKLTQGHSYYRPGICTQVASDCGIIPAPMCKIVCGNLSVQCLAHITLQ